jgi:fatty acid desaturase
MLARLFPILALVFTFPTQTGAVGWCEWDVDMCGGGGDLPLIVGLMLLIAFVGTLIAFFKVTFLALLPAVPVGLIFNPVYGFFVFLFAWIYFSGKLEDRETDPPAKGKTDPPAKGESD